MGVEWSGTEAALLVGDCNEQCCCEFLDSPHYNCIRDVSWHPYDPGVLVATTVSCVSLVSSVSPLSSVSLVSSFSESAEFTESGESIQ